MSKIQSGKSIEIKISTVVAVSVILRETDLTLLNEGLLAVTGGAADYFDEEFAVIDVGAIEWGERRIDWPALVALLKSYRLIPVAVRHAPPEQAAHILAAGLSLDATAQAPRQPAAEPEAEPQTIAPEAVAPATQAQQPEPQEARPACAGTMIIDTPVRAGQRVYARGADLVVTAIVNSGAELIADGSIHVYAPLRGRALAGASGNAAARIFAMHMEAELVSIAGIYSTFENGFAANISHHPAQVRLAGDRLELLPINTH